MEENGIGRLLVRVFIGMSLGYFVSFFLQNPLFQMMMGFGGYVKGAGVILTTRETVVPAVACMAVGALIGVWSLVRK